MTTRLPTNESETAETTSFIPFVETPETSNTCSNRTSNSTESHLVKQDNKIGTSGLQTSESETLVNK
jgi:hypothetical protein